ncbi:CD209 antigen [Lepus europaeus]|uniref:CD209 antigen n=1 Tax=Lepus europaeus TaxID=9983 RepID=UPI002B45C325|nr:CD209 antigen [Lepus europaeus]
MSDSKAARVQALGPLEEEDLIGGSPRDPGTDFGLGRVQGLKSFAGHPWRHRHLLLQLLCLTLLTALLVAILAQVSKVQSCNKQELSKEGEIAQGLRQLKEGVAHLCRRCSWDWTFFQEHCYFFSKSKRNWHDSLSACQDMGAQLVIVQSAEEQSFLQQTSKSKGSTWMGLSDLNKEATWHWVDGSALLLSFMKYWNPGEPNNHGEEDCGEFSGDGWNDNRCEVENFWVCKQPAKSCADN